MWTPPQGRAGTFLPHAGACRERKFKIDPYFEAELVVAVPTTYDEGEMNRLEELRGVIQAALDRWVEILINGAIDIAKIVQASENIPVLQTYAQILSLLPSVFGFHRCTERDSRPGAAAERYGS